MTTFPAAPDFNPQSQQWRRETESKVTSLEETVAILNKNLRAYQRSTVAGTRATNLKISGLQGTRIPPGTPINVTVYPYAHFDASGYPRAGARVYWGDQNDADHYQIWVGKAPVPGEETLGDSPSMVVSQYGTADIRNLECSTGYELAVRAVSYGGSYGFFTATVPFTTPNELTQIGPFGTPYVTYKNGFGVIQWPWTEEYVPAYTESGVVAKTTLSGYALGDGTMYPGLGVRGSDGKFYYPPTENGNGLIVDPVNRTYLYTDFGLGSDPNQFGMIPALGLSQGVLGLDGIIYWVGPGYNGFVMLNTDTLVMTEEVIAPTIGSPSPGIDYSGWGGLALGQDGIICAAPYDSDWRTEFLLIDTSTAGSTYDLDDLSLTIPSGSHWFEGVTDANGFIWFMPESSTTDFIQVETAGIPTAQFIAMDHDWDSDNQLHGAILHPNGSVYAFGADSGTLTGVWYAIAADGTQTKGTTSVGNWMRETAVGSDGLIYGAGGLSVTSDGYWTFNPAALTGAYTDLGSDIRSFRSALADADGNVYFVMDPTASGATHTGRWHIVEPYVYEHPESGGFDIPNYLKHMLVERSSGGEWETLGGMVEPGYFMDPTIDVDLSYDYRLTPVSTAGILGISSDPASLIP